MRLTLRLGVLLMFLTSVCCYYGGYYSDPKIVCFLDSKGLHRFGQSRFNFHYLKLGLKHCTHLIYGYATIQEGTGRLVTWDAYDTRYAVEQNYQKIIKLKSKFPRLKVLVSVGGGAEKDRSKFLSILESAERRSYFIKSARQYILNRGFDGLDLAWPFPETEPIGPKSILKKTLNTLASLFKQSIEDKKATQHRNQFSSLVKHLRAALSDDRLLTLTVPPNVNASIYYDVRRLTFEVDQVHLMNYDYYTPERNPDEADYTAPLSPLKDRKFEANGEFQVRYWLDNAAAPKQIIYGIPTFARTFKMTKSSNKTAIPPLEVDGPGEAGPFTKQPGLLSYGEVCLKTKDDVNGYQKVSDIYGGSGAYAYRAANETAPGIWVGFDDMQTVAKKASFVKQMKLGGVAVSDLTLDDFRGLCYGIQYPIVTTVRKYL